MSALTAILKTVINKHYSHINYVEDLLTELKLTPTSANAAWKLLPSRILGEYLPVGGYTSLIKASKKQPNFIALFREAGTTAGYTAQIKLLKHTLNAEAIASMNKILSLDINDPNMAKFFKLIDSEWAKVTKGRDLFIPGLGGFDIAVAFAKLSEFTSYITVNGLRCIGYFNSPDYYIRSIMPRMCKSKKPKTKPILTYLIRHKTSLNDYVLGALDELIGYITEDTPEAILKLEPRKLLAKIREETALRKFNREQNKKQVIPQQGSKIRGQLKRLENVASIEAFAKKLEICCASDYYIDKVYLGKIQLWVLTINNNSYIGELAGTKKLEWKQIRGYKNCRPTFEVQEIFEAAIR